MPAIHQRLRGKAYRSAAAGAGSGVKGGRARVLSLRVNRSVHSNSEEFELNYSKAQTGPSCLAEVKGTRVGSVPISTWQDDRLPKRCPANKLLLFRSSVCL